MAKAKKRAAKTKPKNSKERLKKKFLSLYLEPEQAAALAKLSLDTGVPQQVYLRRGLDSVLFDELRKVAGSPYALGNDPTINEDSPQVLKRLKRVQQMAETPRTKGDGGKK